MKLTTGSARELSKEDIATFCLPNEAIEIRIDGPFRELERKLWVYLIHRAYENNQLQFGDMHILNCEEIASVFADFHSTKDQKRIWEYFKKLAEIKVTLKCGSSIEGFSSLLSCAVIDHNKGILKYQIPRILEEFYLNQDSSYSRLRTHFILGLKGKYACSLYMIMERFVNRRVPSFEISLEDLRAELKVEDGKLEAWPDFKRRVLDSSIEEIKTKTENTVGVDHGAGFQIFYEVTRKKGKKVTHLTFTVIKTESRLEWDHKMKGKVSKTVKSDDESYRNVVSINLDWEKVSALLQKRSLQCDKYAYFQEWEDWLKDTKKLTGLKTPEFSYVGFIAKKIR